THRDQIDFDPASVGGFLPLFNCPLKPPLLFGAVGDTDLNLRPPGENVPGARHCIFQRFLAGEEVIRPKCTGANEKNDESLPEEREAWSFRVAARWCHRRILEES